MATNTYDDTITHRLTQERKRLQSREKNATVHDGGKTSRRTREQIVLVGTAGVTDAPMRPPPWARGLTVGTVAITGGVVERFTGTWCATYGDPVRRLGAVVVELSEPLTPNSTPCSADATQARVCVSVATSAGWRTLADITRAGPDWPLATAFLAVLAGHPLQSQPHPS